jgi:hypothetical protein
MKKLLCAVPVVLLFALIGASNAHADSYTPTFTCNGPAYNPYLTCPGGPPSAPGVTFGSSTTIAVTVGGAVYDVTLASADSPTDAYTWYFYSGGAPFVNGDPPFPSGQTFSR